MSHDWNLFEVACRFGETEVFPGKYWTDFQFVNYELGSPDCILELDSPGQSSVQLYSVPTHLKMRSRTVERKFLQHSRLQDWSIPEA